MLQFFRAATADSYSSVVEACAIPRSLARISSLCATPLAVLDTHRSQACSRWKSQSNTLQSKIERITVFNIDPLRTYMKPPLVNLFLTKVGVIWSNLPGNTFSMACISCKQLSVMKRGGDQSGFHFFSTPRASFIELTVSSSITKDPTTWWSTFVFTARKNRGRA